MTSNEVHEIVSCLDTESRTLLRYFKDRYAAVLLARAVRPAREGVAIAALKRSPYARLLSRPLIADLVRASSGAPLTSARLLGTWPCERSAVRAYRLTLGRWGERGGGRWQQTSRGGHNLVLQLNFSNRHARALEQLLPDPDDRKYHPFDCYAHPIAEHEYTLAWARLDVDLPSGTVLIEEIQTDWLRLVERHRERVRERMADRSPTPSRYMRAYTADYAERLDRYAERAVAPHAAIWSEAMLTAAVEFARDTLGCPHVFYHTAEHGARLKRIEGRRPPRSLYTKLPRRFCFAETDEVPEFLLEHRRVRKMQREKALRFFRLPE